MKAKFFFTVMALLFAFLLTACGGSSDTQTEADPGADAGDQGEEAPAEGGGSYSIDIGYINATDSETDLGAQKFKELIEERTGGELTVNIFANAQLGGERDLLEGMSLQTVDMVITGDAIFGMFAPEYSGLSLPFLIKDTDHLDRVLDGEVGDEINAAINESLNSRILDYWHRGPRNLTANTEIRTPDDLNGMKLRVPEIPLVVEAWKILGANPTPMAFDQLYVALEQKTVDGQENPLDMIYTSKLHEVQNYVMTTQHLIAPMVVVINNDTFESFPEEMQAQVVEAIEEAGTYQKQLVKENEEIYRQLIIDDGTTIIDDVDRDAFAKKLEESNIVEQFQGEWAPDLVERIRAAE
ncbi:TRAP transporter substrate-binding protein [Halalkalibacter oceani]|uniref:TRAP transporter substrate-binding protein n=1 Tax=Halalkalibacter oceani TaxID=1653776 RepID=UPI00339500DB